MKVPALLCSFVFMCGCSSVQMGVRPTQPPLTASTGDYCADYSRYAAYVQDLQEAYYSRATGNRAGSYASATTSAGAIAGSAGLAVEGAAGAGTLGLLAITQGFLSTLFNIADNPTLASVYTIAGSGLATALDDSFAMIDTTNPTTCRRAHIALLHAVTDTNNNLEFARTDAASAAMQRAAAQTQHYTKIVSEFPVMVPREQVRMTIIAPSQKIDPKRQSLSGATVPIRQDGTLEKTLDGLEQRLERLENR